MLSRRAMSFECSCASRFITAQSDFAFACVDTLNASATDAQHNRENFIDAPCRTAEDVH
jgi:hypothetical protein